MAEILIDTGIVPAFSIKESLIPPADPIPRPEERLSTFEDVAAAVPVRGRSRFSQMSPTGGAVLRRHSHIRGEDESWRSLEAVSGDRGHNERTMLGHFQRRFNKVNDIDHRGKVDEATAIAEFLAEEPLPSPDVVRNSPFRPLLGLLVELRGQERDGIGFSEPVPSENGHKPKTEYYDDRLSTFTSDQLVGLTNLRARLQIQEGSGPSLKDRVLTRPFAGRVQRAREGAALKFQAEVETIRLGDDPMSQIADTLVVSANRTRFEKMISGKFKDRGTRIRLKRTEIAARQEKMRTTQGKAFVQKEAESEQRLTEGAKRAAQQEKVA